MRWVCSLILSMLPNIHQQQPGSIAKSLAAAGTERLQKKLARKKLGGARGGRRGGDEARPEDTFTDGCVFDAVDIEAGKQTTKADYIVSDTRMQIRLGEPLKARGGQVRIHIRYHYQIPGVWGGRTSWGMSQKGEIYDIAQWDPRRSSGFEFASRSHRFGLQTEMRCGCKQMAVIRPQLCFTGVQGGGDVDGISRA